MKFSHYIFLAIVVTCQLSIVVTLKNISNEFIKIRSDISDLNQKECIKIEVQRIPEVPKPDSNGVITL
jgi:hypothetical protein